MRTKFEAYIDKLSPYDRRVKYPAVFASFSFLLIHILLLILFSIYRVTPMMLFNVFSIGFYIWIFFLIRRGSREQLFVTSVYAEVILHMFLAVVCVGWDSGFQITLLGIIIMIFYGEYATRSVKRKYVRSGLASICSLGAYLGAYLVTEHFPHPYAFPHHVEQLLQVTWGIITFVIVIFFLEVFVLITTKTETRLSEQVAHDELTGLFNRHFMNEYLERLMNEKNRYGYFLAMIDIDDFKNVNDTYGHNCGDLVLRTLADVLRSKLPRCEVCRWGGEEFLLVGQIDENLDHTALALDRMRQEVSDCEVLYNGQAFRITITIGVAEFRGDASQAEWINRADERLYHGKCFGKNQVVV